MITRGLERSLTTKGRLARQRILAAAEKLLATRGFHGTSLRDVAREAKIPLATAVYHFARKEQLYSAVLQSIGAQLVAALDEVAKVRGPEGRLELFARALINWTADEPERVRLLLRELLDNPGRVDQASKLPLAPFMRRTIAWVGDELRAQGRTDSPELVALHVVGTVSYFVAAFPTLKRIVGPARAQALARAAGPEQLALLRRVLDLDRGGKDAARPAARARAPRARAPRSTHD